MRGTDKVLIGIVVAIVLLVGVAFAAILLRPEPTYEAEDTPAGVAHNYLLALQRKDYPSAYRHLSPSLNGYPASQDEFERDVKELDYWFADISESTLAIESTAIRGAVADAVIRKTQFGAGGIFDTSQYITNFEMELQLVGGEWKVTDSEDYFLPCWRQAGGCS